MAKPYIILVHGAYHQPSHWDLLVGLLQSAGYSTFAPKLPSSGASPLPGVFDADVSSVKQAILDAIAEGVTSIVPVFHSYGGIPGFEALALLTPKQKLVISRVVCVSAFILPKGESWSACKKAVRELTFTWKYGSRLAFQEETWLTSITRA
jgi:alpha-beta hydrolase superfamily lysophospholipase